MFRLAITPRSLSKFPESGSRLKRPRASPGDLQSRRNATTCGDSSSHRFLVEHRSDGTGIDRATKLRHRQIPEVSPGWGKVTHILYLSSFQITTSCGSKTPESWRRENGVPRIVAIQRLICRGKSCRYRSPMNGNVRHWPFPPVRQQIRVRSRSVKSTSVRHGLRWESSGLLGNGLTVDLRAPRAIKERIWSCGTFIYQADHPFSR